MGVIYVSIVYTRNRKMIKWNDVLDDWEEGNVLKYPGQLKNEVSCFMKE